MKNFLALLFLLSASLPAMQAHSPTIDSLLQRLERTDNLPDQLHQLMALVKAFEREDLAGVTKYGQQGARLALDNDSSDLVHFFLIQTGRAFANSGVMDSALYFFKWARNEAELTSDLAQIASANLYCEYVYSRNGDLDSSMAVTLKAMELFGQIGDSSKMSRAMVTVSEILARQEDAQEAINYAKRAIAIQRRINDSVELAFALEQLGYSYLWTEEYDLAEEAEMEAISIFEQHPELGPLTMGIAYNNLGNIYKNSGRHQLALQAYHQSETWVQQAPEVFFQSHLDFSFCNILIKLGRYEEALERGERALEVFERQGMRRELPELYLRMSEANEGLGNFQAALEYQRKSSAITDSLFQDDSDSRLLELKTAYETQEKEAAILQLETERDRQRWLIFGAMGFGLLLGALVLVLIRNNRRRTEANRLLHEQKAEIERKSAQNELLLKEIHHRVKNNLQTISSLLYLQSAHIRDDEIRQAVSTGQHRVESMALIHQKLYQRENLAAVEMKEYFELLGNNLIESFGMADRVGLRLDMEPLELDVDRAVPLGLIVNELITNSLKYAFPEGRNGKISIRLTSNEPGGMDLLLTDDGTGAAQGGTGTTFGTQLITLLAQQLGANLTRGNRKDRSGYRTHLEVKA